jgi:hypothetical protein
LFAEIRQTMHIPLVTSIWRGRAGMDDSLRLAWAAAKPIDKSGEPEPGAMLWHQVLADHIAGFGSGALYGVQYSDMSAFRAISREALERLALQEMTYG